MVPASDVAQNDEVTTLSPEEMTHRAREAACLLKALSHEGRLMILCHLTAGERSVSDLEVLLNARQAAVSQQLARLRQDGLVSTRRDGKTVYYSIRDERVKRLLTTMYELFCV
ncbi:metalloregulator ArsR/SmtB family transcription factor [Thioclava sp. GXIMD2076]|uniref:Metalloregulator ArsR/SmtB family transcription factor n=1 Tax=Thioclava kandeliae TaxID=3070818 RepID=A0ABV1SH06_9RHOB